MDWADAIIHFFRKRSGSGRRGGNGGLRIEDQIENDDIKDQWTKMRRMRHVVDSSCPEQVVQLMQDIRNLLLRVNRRLDNVDVELPLGVVVVGDG